MDNSQYGSPCAEWRAYDAAHPDLHINDDGFNDIPGKFPSAVALRDAANTAREEASRSGMEALGLDKTIVITEHSVSTADGSSIALRAYHLRSRQEEEARNPPAAYLFYHGGGMLFGTPKTEDLACSIWTAKLAGAAVVVSACYRHTPEHVFPTPHDDAWAAFAFARSPEGSRALGIDPARLLVGGISAGGNLSVAVAVREHLEAKAEAEAGAEPRSNRLRGQLLAIPWLIHRDAYPYERFATREASSLVQCASAPILPTDRYNLFIDLFRVAEPRDPRVSPVLAPDDQLRGLPRTAFIADGWDVLRDDAFLMAERLEGLGISTKKHVFDGLPHAFRKYPDLPMSERWDDLMVESILWVLDESASASEKGRWQVEVSKEN